MSLANGQGYPRIGRKGGAAAAIGSLAYFDKPQDSALYLPTDGRRITKAAYPKLYASLPVAFDPSAFVNAAGANVPAATEQARGFFLANGNFINLYSTALSFTTDPLGAWTVVSGAPNVSWVTYSRGLYVGVRQDSMYQGTIPNAFQTSPDLQTWTARQAPAGLTTFSNPLGPMASDGNGRVVCKAAPSSTASEFCVSIDDGQTWAKYVATGAVAASGTRMEYINGRFILTGAANEVYSSADGIAWVAHGWAAQSGQKGGVAYFLGSYWITMASGWVMRSTTLDYSGFYFSKQLANIAGFMLMPTAGAGALVLNASYYNGSAYQQYCYYTLDGVNFPFNTQIVVDGQQSKCVIDDLRGIAVIGSTNQVPKVAGDGLSTIIPLIRAGRRASDGAALTPYLKAA
jgi:hypothetical protein